MSTAQRPPAPTSPSAPSADDRAAILAIEHAIWDAVVRGDWDAAHGILDGVLFMMNGEVVTWTREVTEARRAMNLPVRGYALDDVRLRPAGADAMVVTYRITLDMPAGDVPGLPPLYYMSTFERTAAGWKLVATAVSPTTPRAHQG
jgi:hypothetical protein